MNSVSQICAPGSGTSDAGIIDDPRGVFIGHPPRIHRLPGQPLRLTQPMPLSLSLYTLLCVLGISVGQLLFKKAATALPATLSLGGLLQNWWLMAALVLYGVTTLGWVWILRHAPLHLAYPFMGLAFLIVPTLAWLLLGEPIGWRTLVGGALILVGVALASTNG